MVVYIDLRRHNKISQTYYFPLRNILSICTYHQHGNFKFLPRGIVLTIFYYQYYISCWCLEVRSLIFNRTGWSEVILAPHGRGHYNDVIMTTMASQITSLTVVYSTVYSDADQRKHQKLRVTGLCVGNSPGLVNSPYKGPVMRKMFPFDDVIMLRKMCRKKVDWYYTNFPIKRRCYKCDQLRFGTRGCNRRLRFWLYGAKLSK